MRKQTILSRFVSGEISLQASYTLGLEVAAYGLRACRNMLINNLSGVQTRRGTKSIKTIANTSRIISYQYKGTVGLLEVTASGVKTIYGNAKAIDIGYSIEGNLDNLSYIQWKSLLVITIPNTQPLLLNIENATIDTVYNLATTKPLWGNAFPVDATFHVDRFVFSNEDTLYGGNSANSGLTPYNFQETFKETITVDIEGVSTPFSDKYYSASSAYHASPISGTDSGFSWIVTGRYILGGSQNGLWVLSKPDGIMSADSLFMKNVSPEGTSAIEAIPKDGGFLYFQGDYKTFCYFEYINSDPVITVLNNSSMHLFEEFKPVRMVNSILPDYIIWILREDGKIVSYQQSKASGISAWALHDFNGFVEDISVTRDKGQDSLLLKINSGGVKRLEVMDLNNEYLDSYEYLEKPPESQNIEKTYTMERFSGKEVSIISVDIYNAVSENEKIIKIIKVNDNGDISIPALINEAGFFIGDNQWRRGRVILPEVNNKPGSFNYSKGAEDINKIVVLNKPEYAGMYLYLFSSFIEYVEIVPFEVRGYEEVIADNNGSFTIPAEINKGFIGIPFNAYIEPRVFSEIHREKKGRVVSIAPVVVKTNGFIYGKKDQLRPVTLNLESGEDFTGQTEVLSLTANPEHFPGFMIKAAKASRLHIISIYVEVE